MSGWTAPRNGGCCAAWVAVLILVAMLTTQAGAGEKRYGPGVSDTEIRIGNTSPYSGPASAFSMVAKTEEAYFRKINAEGGINGALGTAANSAVQKYLNARKVPQLFVSSGAAKWNDPKNFPWTMGFTPSYETEGYIYARHVLQKRPDAKVAIFFQNDDFGKDYLKGIKQGFGDKAASMIVAEEAFDVSEPTIDSHLVKLKSTGADVLFDIATPKFAAQAIKKVSELGWKPLHILSYVSASIGSVIKPAGFENAQGLISAAYFKDPNDPTWKDDAGLKELNGFLDGYFANADRSDTLIVNGYNTAQALVYLLKQCGDDLTRDNVMRHAVNLKEVELGMLLPGIRLNTSPGDFAPIKQWQLMHFEGTSWHLFGDVMSGETKN